jgi:SAM-dependent methyltransferase
VSVRFTDRDALRSAAYADDAKLSARQAIYRYIERPWPSEDGRVLGAIRLRGDEVVADVGCGNGNDVRDLQRAGFGGTVVGFDLSVGMLRTVAPLGIGVVNADAAALPLRDGAVDVALAMHMLYHCPDILATVAELRRIVRPSGALVVSTNARAHLQELRELWTAALTDAAGAPLQPWATATEQFSLEDAPAVIEASFEHVDVQRIDGRLLVPEVEPIVAYIESTRDLSGHGVSDEVWEAGIERLRRRVRSEIASSGALALTVVKGVVVAR